MANGVYQVVTDRIIAQLNQGIIPWRKPWATVNGGAISHSTGKPYALINQILVGRPGEYLTFNQVKAEGGKVRKGEKASPIVLWKKGVEKVEKDGEEEEREYWVIRYYSVFHIDQCEGIKPKYVKEEEVKHVDPIQVGENIIANYRDSSGCKIVVAKSNEAYYNPASDTIVIPAHEQYEHIEEYYSTAFHEMVHSTGHKSRLDRFKDEEGKASHGKEEYSKEELVAEIGSAALMNETGMETAETFENSTAYIQNWLKVLKNDVTMVVRAAKSAEKAAKFILGTVEKEGVNEDKDAEPEVQVEKAEEKQEVQEVQEVMPEIAVEEKPKKPARKKKTTTTTMKKGFEKLIKSASKIEGRPQLHGAFIDKYGMFVALDGCRAYRSIEKLDVPMAPDGERPEISDEFFMEFENKDNLIPLECPDFKELKNAKVYMRGEALPDDDSGCLLNIQGTKSYSFGKGLPAINLAFLKDAMNTFPEAKIFCHKNKGTLSPLFFNSYGKGDAIVLPMRYWR